MGNFSKPVDLGHLMAIHAVRFKGLLFKNQRKRLARAGIEVKSSEPSMRVGLLATGRPIYTVTWRQPHRTTH